jgi:hypothetical protein
LEETDLLLYFQVSALLAVAVAPTTTDQALLQLVKMAGLVVVALSSTEHLLVLEQVAQVVQERQIKVSQEQPVVDLIAIGGRVVAVVLVKLGS